MDPTLKTLVRTTFVFAAIMSWIDAMTTWYVLTRVGIDKEGNKPMAWLMEHLGIGWVCAGRFVVGTFAFWLMARIILGVKFNSKPRLIKVRSFLTFIPRMIAELFRKVPGLPRPMRWLDRNSTILEIIFALNVTAMVAGSNTRAVITVMKGGGFG